MKSGRTLKKRSKPRHKRVTKHVRKSAAAQASAAPASAAPARRTRRMRKSGTRKMRGGNPFTALLKKMGRNTNQQVAPLDAPQVVSPTGVSVVPSKQGRFFKFLSKFNLGKKPNISQVAPKSPEAEVVQSPSSNLAAAAPQSEAEVVQSLIPNLADTPPPNMASSSSRRRRSPVSMPPQAATVSLPSTVLSSNQTPSTKMPHDDINDIIEKSDLSNPEEYNKIKSLIENLDDRIYDEKYKKDFIKHIEKIKAQQKKFDDYLYDLMLNVNTNLIEIKQKNEQAIFIPSPQLTKFKKEFNDFKKFVDLNNERITNEEIRQLNKDTIYSITKFLTENKQKEDSKEFLESLPKVPLPTVPKNVPVSYTLGNIDTILRYFIIYSDLMIDRKTEYTKTIIKTNIFTNFGNARKNRNSREKIEGFLLVIDKLLKYLQNDSVNWNMYVNTVYTHLLSNDSTNIEERLLILNKHITEEKPNLILTSTTDIDKKNDLVRVLTDMQTFLKQRKTEL
jgi:hypothetical protein